MALEFGPFAVTLTLPIKAAPQNSCFSEVQLEWSCDDHPDDHPGTDDVKHGAGYRRRTVTGSAACPNACGWRAGAGLS